jgi:hypothetical protein
LPEISKVDAVDSDRPISFNIFADVWLAAGDVRVSSFLSVAELVWKETLSPQRGGEKWVGQAAEKLSSQVRTSLT